MIDAVAELPGARIFGDPRERISVFCFEMDGLNSTDLATLQALGAITPIDRHLAEALTVAEHRWPVVDVQGQLDAALSELSAAGAGQPPCDARGTMIAHTLLDDMDKETVDFVPNYDETRNEPVVFPAAVPNLLVNGGTGIAVGMATNIPPHNLREVVAACVHRWCSAYCWPCWSR